MAIVATKNGVLRDTETNRFVPGGVVSTAIATSSQGREMQQRRQELKRERLMAGANRIAAEGGQYDGADLDFVEAIGEAAMITALNPDSSRQIHAAELLLTHSGLTESKQSDPEAAFTASDLGAAVTGALVALHDALVKRQSVQLIDIISTDAQDTDGTGTDAD